MYGSTGSTPVICDKGQLSCLSCTLPQACKNHVTYQSLRDLPQRHGPSAPLTCKPEEIKSQNYPGPDFFNYTKKPGRAGITDACFHLTTNSTPVPCAGTFKQSEINSIVIQHAHSYYGFTLAPQGKAVTADTLCRVLLNGDASAVASCGGGGELVCNSCTLPTECQIFNATQSFNAHTQYPVSPSAGLASP
jgi:hypothetical protein